MADDERDTGATGATGATGDAGHSGDTGDVGDVGKPGRTDGAGHADGTGDSGRNGGGGEAGEGPPGGDRGDSGRNGGDAEAGGGPPGADSGDRAGRDRADADRGGHDRADADHGDRGRAGGSRDRADADRGRAGDGRTDRWGRHETPEERADRRWADLLQELRVAQTGVQILFGFLLTVVFQQRFGRLSDTDRHIYVVTVMLGAATTGALVGPVAMHRLLTGRRLKPETVTVASRLTVLGLVLLLCTMASSLLLVLRLAMGGGGAGWLVGLMVAWFVLWWFALPLWTRYHSAPGRR